jgi:integrase
MSTTAKKADPLWQKSSHAGLVRYTPNGTYYARFKSNGKLVWKSLKTDVLSVAVLRLGDLRRQEAALVAKADGVKTGRLTLEDAAAIHMERLESRPDLKPRTKAYYREVLKRMVTDWRGWETADCRRVTKADCLAWAGRMSKVAAPSVYNHGLSLLRHILEISVEMGARYDNPAKLVKRAKVTQKQLTLPEPDQFAAFVNAILSSGCGWSKPCADLVRFLAYGGFRKSEAANVTWADVDFEQKKIRVMGDPETGTKNGEVRRVPMIPEMDALLLRLRAESTEGLPSGPVMRVNECQKAMDRAAKAVGMARITHHDLRHLFATRCIESGVDIPTVSRWLGHKDGGALAMRTYGHLRDEHSAQMAQRVSFKRPTEDIILRPKTSG